MFKFKTAHPKKVTICVHKYGGFRDFFIDNIFKYTERCSEDCGVNEQQQS